MTDQGPWISPDPDLGPDHRQDTHHRQDSDPAHRRGTEAAWPGGPGSYGGDGFRGGPNRPRGRTIAAAILLLALISGTLAVFVIRSRTTAWPPPGWIFAACDVGQGDALALAVGPAEAVVVDTGPDPAKADRCLTLLGVRKIPLVVLTHFHADHIDGVPGVLKGRAVAEMETTNDPDPPRGAAEVAAWAGSAGVPTSVATAGEHRQFGPVSWDVLWPDPNASPPLTPPIQPPDPAHKTRRRGHHQARASPRGGGEEGSGPNNSSVVLQVTVATRDGPVRLLLTGDVEPPAQAAILAAHPDLAADVLKVPHHGSAHQDPNLFAAIHPRVAVISVGKGNTYGHPAPRTIALAATAGARVFRTDEAGQVVVFGTASRLRVAMRH